jgi:DNA polymerase III subunit epsilon
MKALFYDTETTGLPLFNNPSEDPRQPHIVQLAALLVDLDTRKIYSSIDFTVKHVGWESEPKALEAHGITAQLANQVGIPEALALRSLIELWTLADIRIGHNEQFDARIVKCALHRYDGIYLPESWKAGRSECTQIMSTPVLKLPPTDAMRRAGRTHHKSANLREAYEYFMGDPLVDAHSAMADARACMSVYFAIKNGARLKAAAAAGIHA